MFPATNKSKVSEDAVQQIIDMIRAGDYAPGDQLPSERELARQLSISRTPLREALRKLETIGLVEIRHGQGTFVKDPSHQVIQTSLMPFVFADEDTSWKLFQLREIIEVEAAGLAAQHANADQIQTMRRWMDTMETHAARDDTDSLVVADVEFHRQIIIATGNDILVGLMDSIVDLLREMRRASPSFPGIIPRIITDHRAILAAIEAHDNPGAKLAMQEHLNDIRETMNKEKEESSTG